MKAVDWHRKRAYTSCNMKTIAMFDLVILGSQKELG